MSAQAIADQCANAGADQINRQVIANLENGRRGYVSIDELLVLAYVLNVPPVLLFVPVGTANELAVTPTESGDAFGALMWVTGEGAWSAESMREWRELSAPLTLTRDVWQRYNTASATRRDPESDEYADALRLLAFALNRWVEMGVPFPVRVGSFHPDWSDLVADMKTRSLLTYPDEIPVNGGDDGAR